MNKIIYFLIIFGALYFFGFFYDYYFNKPNLDGVIKDINAMENAASIDESIKAMENYNKDRLSGFQDLQKLAKSKEAFKFVELTANQNRLGIKGQELAANVAEDIRFLQSIDWETDNENELERIQHTLDRICPILLTYLDVSVSIVNILDEKIILSNHPNVQKELFGNSSEEIELLKVFRASQGRVMEREKSAYQSICVTN